MRIRHPGLKVVRRIESISCCACARVKVARAKTCGGNVATRIIRLRATRENVCACVFYAHAQDQTWAACGRQSPAVYHQYPQLNYGKTSAYHSHNSNKFLDGIPLYRARLAFCGTLRFQSALTCTSNNGASHTREPLPPPAELPPKCAVDRHGAMLKLLIKTVALRYGGKYMFANYS